MNYILHLNKIFERFYDDQRLTGNHIAMYIALFQYWNMNRFKNPITIHRAELMKVSKIGSINTYLRILKELHSWEYLEYKPSYNPHRGSEINLYTFDIGKDTSTDNSNEPLAVKDLIPLININKLNKHNKQKGEHTHEKENLKNGIYEFNAGTVEPQKMKVPELEEVRNFFKEEKYPEVEAQKFYNYFESNGWKVGGKAPMKNWKAAAVNWMLNAQKFSSNKIENPKPGNLSTGNEKNYGEPL